MMRSTISVRLFVLSALALGLSLTPFAHTAFAAPLTDPLVNDGFEQAGESISQAYDWQAYGSGYTRASDKKHGGSWSVKLTNTGTGQQRGAYQRIDLQQTSVKPVFVGAWIAGNNIDLTPSAWVGASMYAEIVLVDGTVVYWNSVKNTGTFDWRWVGFNTGTLPQVNQPIDHMFIIPIFTNGTGTAWFDDISVSEHDPAKAAVTLMFDDGEITTYTEARPALAARKMPGVAAIVTSFVGVPGYMNLNQIKALSKNGWEIASHGVTHDDFTAGTVTQMRNQLRNSKNKLTQWGFLVQNVAYPFGAYNALLLAETQAAGYRSGRAYELGDNPQGTFPFDVKVRSVFDTTTPEEVAGWLAEAKANKRWEVIVFHTIAAQGDDAYHIAPATFRAILTKVAASGVPVVTYNEGLNLFGVSNSTTNVTPPSAPQLPAEIPAASSTEEGENEEPVVENPEPAPPEIETTAPPAVIPPKTEAQIRVEGAAFIAQARTAVANVRQSISMMRSLAGN
jgi:peptidoglycan/xylan/chitin deacetylase (PgdA/CDA1 family)